MSWRIVLGGGLALLLCCSTAISGIDVDGFNLLPDRDRYDVLIAGLKGRELKLSSLGYALSEEIVEIDKGARHPLRRSNYEAKFSGVGSFLHCKRTSTTGEVTSEFWSSWDGKQQRSLTKLAQDASPRGLVQDREVQFIRECYFNHLLGIRANGTEMPLSSWVEGGMHKKWSIAVTAVREVSVLLLKLDLQPDKTYGHTFWIDPAQEFMVVRHEYHADYGKNHKGRASVNVTKSERVDGLSIPVTAVRQNQLDLSEDIITEYRFKITAVTFDSRKVLEPVVFPAGTRVFDGVAKEGYEIGDHGEKTMLPIYDAGTGKVIAPR